MSIYADAQSGKLTPGALKDYLEKDPGILNRADGSGNTPLGYALLYGKASVVKLLLDNSADPDQKLGTATLKDGRTPVYLAATAKPPPRMLQLLLEKKPTSFDEPIPAYNNETPLMAAISRTQDPDTVKLLVQAGASLEVKNKNGKTARDLADALPDGEKKTKIKEALEPTIKKGGGGGSLRAYMGWVVSVLSPFSAWKTLASIFNNASRYFYGIDSPDGLHPEEEDEVDKEPQTAADFKNNLQDVVDKGGLDRFFPPGNTYVQEVADKAAALKNDPNNVLNSPSQLKGLSTLALFQPVLYLDDSGSMWKNDTEPYGQRWAKQAQLAKLISEVANLAVPVKKGIHLRFINNDSSTSNNLDSNAVAQKVNSIQFKWLSTPIGTKLKERILQPLVYSVIDSGQKLERPYLIMIITDGTPWGEDSDTFRNAVLECTRRLQATKPDAYRKDAVRFCISQIGTDDEAKDFMNSLSQDGEVLEVLHRTAELLDQRYDELRDNEAKLKDWLLTMLLTPVEFINSP